MNYNLFIFYKIKKLQSKSLKKLNDYDFAILDCGLSNSDYDYFRNLEMNQQQYMAIYQNLVDI